MRRGCRGATMFALVLFISVLIAGASAAYVDVILSTSRQLEQLGTLVMARSAADGAIEKFVWEIERSPVKDFDPGTVIYEYEDQKSRVFSAEATGERTDTGWKLRVQAKGSTPVGRIVKATFFCTLQPEAVGTNSRWLISAWDERAGD